jgi:hypothetical protein
VHDRTAGVVVEQMFAVRGCAAQHPSVNHRRALGEPPLRAGHRDRLTAELALVQSGQPVKRVTFGHA